MPLKNELTSAMKEAMRATPGRASSASQRRAMGARAAAQTSRSKPARKTSKR